MKCAVDGCKEDAAVRVLLFDVYRDNGGRMFLQDDFTRPYLCEQHVVENELKADGERRPRGSIDYPHTNAHGAQGFTMYQPLD